MNKGIYVSQFWFPQGICLGVGLLGHMVVLCLVFLRNLHTIFYSDWINLHSHQQCKSIPLNHVSLIYFYIIIWLFPGLLPPHRDREPNSVLWILLERNWILQQNLKLVGWWGTYSLFLSTVGNVTTLSDSSVTRTVALEKGQHHKVLSSSAML